jgi:transcriptional regulator GlxA family with amidase domain
MSPRHFARTFHQQVGVTPARYVENVRLEAARRRLEESRDPVELVASACGFGSTESMRRAFLRGLGVAPSEYRRRFGVPIPA